jgi:hypothetical protein
MNRGSGSNCVCMGRQSLYPVLGGGCSVSLSGLGLQCSSQGTGFQRDPGCGKSGTLYTCSPALALGFTVACNWQQRGTAVQGCH